MHENETKWQASFEKEADDWQKVYVEHDGFRYHVRSERMDIAADLLKRHCPEAKGTEVLDLGCGPGLFCSRMAAEGYSMTGLDYSEKMIHIAEENTGKDGVAELCTFRSGDFHSVELPEGKYDAVVALGFVEYIFDVDRLYEKIGRLLKPNGVAIVQIYNIDSIPNVFDFATGPFRVFNPAVVLRKIFGSGKKQPALPAKKESDSDSESDEDEPIERIWYTPKKLDAALKKHDLEKAEGIGHVFGNFKYRDKRVFSENNSIRLEKLFRSASRGWPFRWLNFKGDNDIASYVKKS